MNGYTTPQEYIAQAEACLATAKEELAKARAAQAQARVWIALVEIALAKTKTEPDWLNPDSWHTLGDFSIDENGIKVYNVTDAQGHNWISRSPAGDRQWTADSEDHVREQHHDAFGDDPDEKILEVFPIEECDFHDGDSRDPLACTCDESTI
jgi:hypothetical protein